MHLDFSSLAGFIETSCGSTPAQQLNSLSETISDAVIKPIRGVSLVSLDESATKQGVVLRLLSLAGWDAFHVSEFVPEYTVGSRRVGPSNAVFIEVKRPGENLEEHQRQILVYCFQQGVRLAAGSRTLPTLLPIWHRPYRGQLSDTKKRL